MGKKKPDTEALIDELVDYLRAKLETILANWRLACEADPTMSSKSSFSREEFNDQVPVLIQLLFLRLKKEEVPLDPGTVASEHGLHRWQSGYSLAELIAEMEHLFKTIFDEVEAFELLSGKMDPKTLLFVQQQIFKVYGESNRGSLIYYHQLLQNDAAERARSLQFALDQLHQLGEKRGEHLRQSSHDLRTSFSIMTVASQMLEYPKTEKERTELMDMLNRNLASIREMLLQLTDYAKIEAGQDALDIQQFDAAKLIKDTLETAQPLAKHHKLILQGAGPDKLKVTGDRVKVQRILINLLYNSLKYTKSGSVYVTWALDNQLRWSLSIQDTGPGFAANSPAALLAEQLKPNVITSASHQEPQLMEELPPGQAEQAQKKESEGLGLFIVKKLCELMKASMDIESIPGKGTLVRIRFMMQPE
ncbi:sensor histidine kinase [Dyadobacter crusticola]|uniref:sensor histidine kinase n=1 Tax=Dyadobacter crusticola TaxID=292407 RepID=UPI0004E1ED74|nr:sensor histidine kinase [Dyadobacter crusticola]